MLLGTKETLSEETDALLTHHGIRHVVSVSGLHLVLILSIWGFLCRKLHFHRWLTFGTTAVWTALYALMVGAPISILRAGFMFLNFGLYFRMPNGIAGDVDRFLTRRLQNKTDRRAKRFSQIVVLPDDVRAGANRKVALSRFCVTS